MGAIKATKTTKRLTRDVSKQEHKTISRKVTFVVTSKNGKRVFTPVNKRAKAFAAVAGVDQLSRKHLVGIKKLGYKLAASPSLTTITL